MSHFSLTAAYLCPDCEVVGDNSRQCACCGSRALLSLANALNRETVDAYAEEKALWALEQSSLRGR